MSEETREELTEAVRRIRDRDFAHLVSSSLTLAMDTAPDIIRAALRRVFELPETEKLERRLSGLESQAEQALFSMREVEIERRRLDEAFRSEHQCRIGVLEEVRELREQVKTLQETQEKMRLFLIQKFDLKPAPPMNGVAPSPTPVRQNGIRQ